VGKEARGPTQEGAKPAEPPARRHFADHGQESAVATERRGPNGLARFEDGSGRPAGGYVPLPGGAVAAGRPQRSAVRSEGDREHAALMPLRQRPLFAALDIPERDRAVGGRGGEHAAVRATRKC